MAALNLLEPISDDAPCGPDLERQDDDAFLDYYFEAESRLPERYFTPGLAPDGREDRQFDPKSIDIGAETAAINALLARSRDLRLLSLLARFQILSGRLEDFTSTVEDMAAMMAQWPDDLHPKGADRRAAVDSLNSQATVVMPLLHLPLLPSSDMTLRRFMVSTGRALARASEGDLAGADLLSDLRSDANARAIGAVHDRLNRVADALHRMLRLAGAHRDTPFHPELGALRTAVADMQGMIAAARPELRPWSASAAPQPVLPDPAEPVADAPPLPDATPGAARHIPDRATAAAALDAACDWLTRSEPSSPAVMLVAQARLLVGKSLVEAIEILLPAEASGSMLRLGQGTPFTLPMERLKVLTQAGFEGQDFLPENALELPAITRRSELVASLLGVEGYFTANEPASPIPLLLVKAREMLDKRFDAIIAELLASSVTQGQS